MLMPWWRWGGRPSAMSNVATSWLVHGETINRGDGCPTSTVVRLLAELRCDSGDEYGPRFSSPSRLLEQPLYSLAFDLSSLHLQGLWYLLKGTVNGYNLPMAFASSISVRSQGSICCRLVGTLWQ